MLRNMNMFCIYIYIHSMSHIFEGTESYNHLFVTGAFSVIINVLFPLPGLSIIKQAKHTLADVRSILCGLLKRLPWQHRVVRH